MISVVARAALSGLGQGREATGVGKAGEAARVAIARDVELEKGGLARPLAARVRVDASDEDRATTILRRVFSAVTTDLDATRPGWRRERIGLALATSSGGMRSAEIFFDRFSKHAAISCEVATNATYFAPLVAATRDLKIDFSPATLVLTACAASTIATGIGARWLEAGDCDLVIAGGFDAVSVFVASGFEVLRATTGEIPPKPFCAGRDGMSLGEAGALFALARDGARAQAYVAGFGASSDAVHLTAPDRTGDGLARAAEIALKNAEIDASAIDLVSAHATATPFNDAAEIKALARVLGSKKPTIVPLKAQLGHTLGAAGAIETMSCIDAMEAHVLPASASHGAVEPDLPAELRSETAAGEVGVALKISAAFGGANAALVITHDAPKKTTRRIHDVFVSRGAFVRSPPDLAALSSRTGVAQDKLARGDGLVRYAIAACAALEDACGSLRGAGIVVGHSLATLETNYLYNARIIEKGAKYGEPRRFPYTTPNAVAGECGVAFGLTGPGMAVSSGLHGGLEALTVGYALVRSGDAERMVIVAVDEIEDAARALARAAGYGSDLVSGAVAVLVSRDSQGYAKIESATSSLNANLSGEVALPGHLALTPLLQGNFPEILTSSSPWGAARVKLAR